jgi:ribosomal protein S12 methylthiotransferase
MELQAGISAARLKDKIGKRIRVLIDRPGIGRSAADAPEVDGVVHVRRGHRLKAGAFADVLIEGRDEHDVFGRLA